jgi:intein/homing endonuclease
LLSDSESEDDSLDIWEDIPVYTEALGALIEDEAEVEIIEPEGDTVCATHYFCMNNKP